MPDPRPGSANKVPPVFGDLLAASAQLAGGFGRKLTHEQTVMAIMGIIRRKAHPAARLRRNADGSYTITIPAPTAKDERS